MRENSQKKFTFKKIKFSKQEIDDIAKKVDKKLKKSIDIAFKRIKLFIRNKNSHRINTETNIIMNFLIDICL